MTMRQMMAAERRQQRAAQRLLRELKQLAKEQEKLSALEQARLEVETFENRLELLLSVHKEQGSVWDWNAIRATPAPAMPPRSDMHEANALKSLTAYSPGIFEIALGKADKQSARLATEVDVARQQDEAAFQQARRAYQQALANWEEDHRLAEHILAGESKAYAQALRELSPFAEIAELGSSIQFSVENSKLIKCALKVNGNEAIPSEVKSLTASGKVSTKPMPKPRFHEIYQDYVCGSVLRVAREVFALLPVETVLVTALADIFDSSTGRTTEQPVLSVALPRAVMAQLHFDQLDPSDAMENFLHRGDFKASRKSGAFAPIVPLEPPDLCAAGVRGSDFHEILASVRRLREQLKVEACNMDTATETVPSEETPPW